MRPGDRLRHSVGLDWLLLVLLWITGATGFFIEVALYLPNAPSWGYWVFPFHIAVAMELMLLLPLPSSPTRCTGLWRCSSTHWPPTGQE